VIQPQGRRAGQFASSTLVEAIDQAHGDIDQVHRTPHVAYSFLRHAQLMGVMNINPTLKSR
jgi:hypothetical protein